MAPGSAEDAESKTALSAEHDVTIDKDPKVVTGKDVAEAIEGANTTANPETPEGKPGAEDEVYTSETDEPGVEEDHEVNEPSGQDRTAEAPPLPNESIPPLPEEAPPTSGQEDDGWAPIWEESAQAFYFYNRFTGATQWTNPRVSDDAAPGVEVSVPEPPAASRLVGGYDPAIHGDYDPTAWYAQPTETELPPSQPADPTTAYAATAAFNRFTGRFQNADLAPENFNDENKSKRQMNAFFDVDAAANSHDGRSLKEERSGKKLTKAELKKFKEKRKAKKEEKRKAWLRD